MILVPEVKTRINDKFITDASIDASPIYHDVVDIRVDGGPNSVRSRYQASFYKNFGLDIVTESVFHYPYAYISEKTMRPIACKRMFIIVGAAGTLKLLHDKGFETFGDFLDETYDDLSDPTARFQSILNCIKTYLDRPLDEIKKFYRQNQKRFDHNFAVLTNLRALECDRLRHKLLNDC